MIDKVQKIREELKRIMEACHDENGNPITYGEDCAYARLLELKEYIDSMQEEPYGPNLAEKATKMPEKAFKQMESNSGPKDKCKGCNNVKGCITCVDGSEWAHYEEPILSNVGRTVKSWREEPVSEEQLNTAAIEWICDHKEGERLFVKDAFIAGVKWILEKNKNYGKQVENKK